MVRGAGCHEINLRIRRREKNVLDIPFYRPGVYTIYLKPAFLTEIRPQRLLVTAAFHLPRKKFKNSTAFPIGLGTNQNTKNAAIPRTTAPASPREDHVMQPA
jgi:hypothetical protein